MHVSVCIVCIVSVCIVCTYNTYRNDHIHTKKVPYTLDTYIYVHILSLKPYWILKFLHVFAYVFARICTYLCTYLYVYARMSKYTYIDATNNFPYRKYVHIRSIRAYTYTNTYIYVSKYVSKYVQHTADRMCTYCTYMQVYTCICMYSARIRMSTYCTYMQVWASLCMYATMFLPECAGEQDTDIDTKRICLIFHFSTAYDW